MIHNRRRLPHDTSVEDYVESLVSKKHKREGEARSEIVGRIFEKRQERQAKSAH